MYTRENMEYLGITPDSWEDFMRWYIANYRYDTIDEKAIFEEVYDQMTIYGTRIFQMSEKFSRSHKSEYYYGF